MFSRFIMLIEALPSPLLRIVKNFVPSEEKETSLSKKVFLLLS